MPKWLARSLKWVWGAVGAIIVAVIGTVLYDQRDTLLKDLRSVSPTAWALILYVPLCVVVITLGILEYRWRSRLQGDLTSKEAKLTDLQGQSEIDTQLLGLDDTLLRLMPGMLQTPDLEEAVRNLLRIVLKEVTEVFPRKVFRAYMLKLNQSKDTLVPWVGYQMSHETMTRSTFHVGGGDNPRMGDAGWAFIHKQLRVVHKRADESMESAAYIEFDESRQIRPYQAFVCVPLVDLNDTCQGILCLDSHTDSEVFDPPEIQTLLLALGARLATVVFMYGCLKHGGSP